MFEQEMVFFKENQDTLVHKYKGKVLVIVGKEVFGVFNNTIDAYKEATRNFEPGTFMIQPCMPGPEAYTVTISTSGITRY